MKRLSPTLILSLFPIVLFIVLVVFYLVASMITGNIFERERGRVRPFAFSQAFTMPINGHSPPSGSWLETSFWAWPFNALAQINPYIYFVLAGIITFSLFVHFQLRSDPLPDETKSERQKAIRASIRTVGLGILGEIVVFSIIMYLFFSSKAVVAYTFPD